MLKGFCSHSWLDEGSSNRDISNDDSEILPTRSVDLGSDDCSNYPNPN